MTANLRTFLGSLVVILVVATFPAEAGPRRPHATLDKATSKAVSREEDSAVIVRYRPGSQTRVLRGMAAERMSVRRRHGSLNAISMTTNGAGLRKLVGDEDVIGISADAKVKAHQDLWSSLGTLTAADAQQLRSTLGLPKSPTGGRGVGVAIIDSGIAPTPDLIGRIVAFRDFTRGGIETFPSDDYGHGTHVAGLIAGNGLMSAGRYVGVAPEARLIGLKVLDDKGNGRTSDVIAAIELAIDNRVALGIHVINLSLGHPILEPAADDPLVQAVENASAAGLIVVASAGNFGKAVGASAPGFGGITSPGNAPSALTVGAARTEFTISRADDSIPDYSSRGPSMYDSLPKPDFLAPGSGLIATSDPRSLLGSKSALQAGTSGYIRLSGTSMAAAVATGVVALMVEANRVDNPLTRLTPNMVKMMLQFSATHVDRTGDNLAPLREGAGEINAMGAVELARAVNPGAAVGDYWLERGFTTASTIGGQVEPWTRIVTWADSLLNGEILNRAERAWLTLDEWGTPVTWTPGTWSSGRLVYDNLAAWSAALVWSSQVVALDDDDHIVWGNSFDDDHIVWGNSFDDDHIVWGNSFLLPGELR